MLPIQITKASVLKEKPKDENSLGFGKTFTDHMFMMRYTQGVGWHDPKVEPYRMLSFDPASSVLHYGQALFEGMKAYRDPEGGVRLFRPAENFSRMSIGAQRIAMPPLDEETAMAGLKALLELEKDWIPSAPNTSLYIRPTMIATDVFLGVHASRTYLFFIILSPVGPYYKEGLAPVKIYVESKYVRAVRGGIGYTKAAANYAASLLAGVKAEENGFSQVIWLDGVEQRYVEEVGSMNMFFVFDGELVTAPLLGSILPGITRKSVIELAESMGVRVSERRIPIDEVERRAEDGTMTEAFGTGTAAVISPVGEFYRDGHAIQVGDGKMGPLSAKMYDTLTGIQYGRLPDPFGWSVKLK